MVKLLKDNYFRHFMLRAASRAVGAARREFIRIHRAPGELGGSAMAKAVRAPAWDRFSPEDLDWISRVEAIRSGIVSSRAEVRQTDSGATAGGRESPGLITRSVAEICRAASKPKRWPGLLRRLVRLVREFRPESCLEMGTCLAINACYQGAGLHMNRARRLVMLEGARANPRAVLVFNDIIWSNGIKRAWRTVTASPRVFYPMNLHTLGVCIYGKR